jgi:hypothetical protein
MPNSRQEDTLEMEAIVDPSTSPSRRGDTEGMHRFGELWSSIGEHAVVGGAAKQDSDFDGMG